MKNKLLFFLFILLTIPGISSGAEIRTLEIEFAFTAPDDPARELMGYRLYQESELVCETIDPTATILTCDILTEDGTFDFTLTAHYYDDSESPPSPSFPYTIGSTTVTPPTTTPEGSRIITYSWDQNVSNSDIAGYRMYMNDTLLCATDDPTATTLSCTADLINAPMAFSVASYDINGLESPRSNILQLDPADFPELFLNKSITFNWDYTDNSSNEGGFRIYNSGSLLCETADFSARQLTCQAELSATNTFTMTAVDASGLETTPSNALVYTVSTEPPPVEPPPTEPEPLQAVISPVSAVGEVPLSVSFAGTASTGDISAYHWQFGDGTTGTGSTADHIYTIPGTYSATLSVEDPGGATSLATTTIIVQPGTTEPLPPTAILSSSTAAGDAPLTVNFDGASSTTPNPPIVAYSWTMGDGSETTGETISYTYSTAGTYHTELTVTDSLGLTDKIDTPIIVIGTVAPNEKPTAVISSDLSQGDAPLAVSFNGSESSDPDGSIAQYNWNFGDGTAGSGPTVQHTYTSTAIYTVSLQVTDNQGETATTTREITCNTAPPEVIVNFEVGEVNLDSQWVQVLFENNFNQPVVIAGPPVTVNEDEPVLVRISNINQDGFEIRLQEWDYQDGTHAPETFSYIVIEKGTYTLNNGVKIEAGSFTGSARFQKVSLQQPYDLTPVILTQVMTNNDADAVTGRIRKSGQSSFDFKLQEQETTQRSHTTETVGYIAWEPGKGEIQGLLFETGITDQTVTHDWFDLTFQTAFPDQPLMIATMQTSAGGEPAAIRGQNLTKTTTQIKVEEEQSKDSETAHTAETVGYLIIGNATAPPN